MTDGSLATAMLTKDSGTTAPTALVEACGFPEIGSLLDHLSVRIDANMQRPLRLDGTMITVSPAVAGNVEAAAMAMREAIELSVLGAGRLRWSDRIVAFAAALSYRHTTLRQRITTDLRTQPDSFPELTLHQLAHDSLQTATRLARHLEERDGADAPAPDSEIQAAARALPLAAPTEVLLTMGGDDRQNVAWEHGVNTYDVSPRPMPWRTTFGSCTASAPTYRGFDAARRMRLRLVEAALIDDLDRTVQAEAETTRRTILAALGVDQDYAEVILTPSGTDAELVAASLALAGGEPITSIIVGPTEIGSGSVPAAGGQHFTQSNPAGGFAVPGEDVIGFSPDDVQIVEIAIRHDSGELIDPDEVESAIEQAIIAAPDRILLHIVEGSKTGIRLPRSRTVDGWERRWPDRLDVVVDAAQMRIDQQTVVRHLNSDRMVFVTGSKFFGGPPFSGAVLIPGRLAKRLDADVHLPSGLSSYLTEVDVPDALARLRSVARPGANYGLLLRWGAALAEMQSFHNASPEIRDEVLRRLAAGLRQTLEAAPFVQIVESPYTAIPSEDHRGLDDLPTIFTFLAIRPDGSRLDHDAARALHRLLGRDASDLVGIEDQQLARRCFYLGQPVRVVRDGDRWLSALRFAIGAPTISQVVFDHTRGERWTDRVDRELDDVSDALAKIDLLLRVVDLNSPELQAALGFGTET